MRQQFTKEIERIVLHPTATEHQVPIDNTRMHGHEYQLTDRSKTPQNKQMSQLSDKSRKQHDNTMRRFPQHRTNDGLSRSFLPFSGHAFTMFSSAMLVFLVVAPTFNAQAGPQPAGGASKRSRHRAATRLDSAQRQAAAKPETTIYWFIRSTWRAKTDELVSQIEESLSNDSRIRFKDSQAILEPPRAASQAFSQAERLIEAGKKFLFQLDLDKASEQFAAAVRLYETHLAWLIDSPFGTGKLVDALSSQALGAFRTGDSDLLEAVLSKIQALDPQWKVPKSFPAEMKENLMNLRLEQDELGKARLQVATHPNAGVVYLDGKKLGRAPLLSDPVPAGLHYLTIRRRGFRSLTKTVQVTPPRDSSLDIPLEPVDASLLSHLKNALSEMGATLAGPGIRATARRLDVVVLVLGRILVRGSEASVTLVAYDTRKGKITGPAITKTVDLQSLSSGPAHMVQALVDEIAPKPKPRKARPAARKRPKQPSRFLLTWRRFRKWPGFWYMVGGTAALILTGVAVGLAVGLTSQSPNYPGAARHILFLRAGQRRPAMGRPAFVPAMWRFP